MTTATDGPMEAVVHGVTGWIPGEKPEGWAEAVVELAGSVTVREEIRAAARRWVEEHFSMVKNTGLLVAAIRACEETPVRQDGGKNL
jgi:glycosyltransferase involved in cell wall biosynthesis